MGDIEYGNCDICNIQAPLTRRYYRYDIKCDCCNGSKDDHFEIVRYCLDCKPKPPRRISVVMKPINREAKKLKIKNIELWQEGFAATGESSKAERIGEYLAENFDDAMKMYMSEKPNIEILKNGDGSGNYSSWAMRIFDNEAEARASFG